MVSYITKSDLWLDVNERITKFVKIKCLNRISAVIFFRGGRALGILFVVLLLDNLVCVGDRLVESPDGETTHTLRPLGKPNDPLNSFAGMETQWMCVGPTHTLVFPYYSILNSFVRVLLSFRICCCCMPDFASLLFFPHFLMEMKKTKNYRSRGEQREEEKKKPFGVAVPIGWKEDAPIFLFLLPFFDGDFGFGRTTKKEPMFLPVIVT